MGEGQFLQNSSFYIMYRFFFFFEKKEGGFGASPLLPHPKAAGLHNENTVPEYRAWNKLALYLRKFYSSFAFFNVTVTSIANGHNN